MSKWVIAYDEHMISFWTGSHWSPDSEKALRYSTEEKAKNAQRLDRYELQILKVGGVPVPLTHPKCKW